MPCGTSRVVSTIPATMSLASHWRRYDERLRPRAIEIIGTTFRQLDADFLHVRLCVGQRCLPAGASGITRGGVTLLARAALLVQRGRAACRPYPSLLPAC